MIQHTPPEYNVLLIDDEESNVGVLEETLTGKYALTSALTAEEGWELLQKKNYHIVLLDIMLPGMDGYTLCQKIRREKRFSLLKIFLISGLSLLDERLKGYEVGADEYIVKPFNTDELEAKVNVFCRLYEAEKRLQNLNENLEAKVDEKTKKLQEIYVTDELTGLFNRQKLIFDLKKTSPRVFLLLNVVSFRSVNLALGLEAGNAVLKEIALKLKELLHDDEEANLYRLDRDDFACSLFRKKENFSKEQDWIREFHQTLNSLVVHYDDVEINITTSVGAVIDEEKDLLSKGILTMMKAKEKIYPKIEFYKKSFENQDKHRENLHWIKKLKEAIEKRKVVPFFQGIYNNQTNKIEKYECLVRLIENDKVVSPFAFLSAAKNAGMMTRITEIMIEGAFVAMAERTYDFSLNITDEDLMSIPLAQVTEEALANNHIAPERVTFEVLENISLSSQDKLLYEIEQLKKLGCKIAIDDFGTENSNFAQIMNLQVDFIKIDGRFIKNIYDSERSYKIAKTITEFGHNIGAKVIAEFVYCKGVQDKVIELGIDYSQGYYFSEPSSEIV